MNAPSLTWFCRARVPVACLPPGFSELGFSWSEPWAEVDIATADGRIALVEPASVPRAQGIDLGGLIVFPGLIDCHTHLDKTHTWDRAPNPTGEFWDAIRVLHADSGRWTESDLMTRASYAMRCAWAHGTAALRTHLDTGGDVGAASFDVVNTLREEWRGRITLQTVSLCNLQEFADGGSKAVLERTRRSGATALGGFPQPNARLAEQLDALLRGAMDLGVGIDLHVDESGLVGAECLRATAEAVLRNRFPHPVACGHNCSLAVQERARALDTIRLVKEAGIHLISLPLCNQYLQGRTRDPKTGESGTPFWRGVTLLHEALAAGVVTACASDNVRDAFFAWGDYDMLEVWQQAVRIGHLDTRISDAICSVTTAPAKVMGLADHGRVEPGARASLVVTDAPTLNRLLARPNGRRRRIEGDVLLDVERPPWPNPV